MRLKSSRLVRRLRILYFLLPLLTVVVILGVASVISRNIANDTARQMSRQYSIEAASNFQMFISSHLQVMNRFVHCTLVARWLADENDPAVKAAAFEAMMSYTADLPDYHYVMTVKDSLHGYVFEAGMSDFAVRGVLDIHDAANQWFFDTANAEMPFILNIQRGTPDAYGNWGLYIWFNHRIYYQGRLVGFFALGSPFEAVFDATFGNFYAENKRGYIIDRHGMVRLDSDLLLETEIDGIPARPPIPEAVEGSALAEAIDRLLQKLDGGRYPLGLTTCDAIPLTHGEFRYASITPIIGTDWSIVVFSVHEAGFDERYFPLVLITIVLLMCLILSASAVVRDLLLTPLRHLARSVAQAGTDLGVKIYGTERDDEIGDISRAVHKMMQERTSFMAERGAHEMAKTYLDSSPMYMSLRDSNFNLVYCNHQVLTLFGVADDKEFDERIDEFFPKFQPCGTPSKKKFDEVFNRALTDGSANLEWMYLTPTGEPLPVDITMVRIMLGENPHVIVYGHDLRSVKKALDRERVLLKKERQAIELTQNIQKHSPFFMEFWDTDEKLIDCNDKIIEVLGCESKAEFAANFFDYCVPVQPCGTPTKELNEKLIAEAMETGFARGEWTFLMKTGEELPVESTWVRITHRDKPIIIVYSQDLRPVKAAAQSEESNKAKSRFLARMSHEIRTPITAILGLSEIQLRNQSMPPKTEEAFTKIYNSSKALLNIVNDILDFSRIEAGKISIVNSKYSVAELISSAAQIYSMYSEKKAVAFQVYADETLPAHLIGDALRIRQIVANFLTNAFKFTEAGTVHLSVYCEKARDGFVTLVIAIKDTGIGMTAQQVRDLRGEYIRHHEHEMPFIAGTGLGIPIVYSLAELMGAEVNITSEPEQGTTATLRIPQETTGDEVLGAQLAVQLQNFEAGGYSVAKELVFEPAQFPHGKVLVVDDVETNLHVAEAMLEVFGVSIELANSAKEAIKKIEDGSTYDVIFMDYMMPDMTGLEAIKILREMGYDKPIVALTANALKGQAEMFMENGFSGFMSKPVDIKIFNSYLMRFVRKPE